MAQKQVAMQNMLKSLLVRIWLNLTFYRQVSDKLVEAFDKKSLESVTSFMDFYHGHGQRLNKELFATKEKIKKMEDEIKIIDDRLSELAPLGQTGETSYNDKYVKICFSWGEGGGVTVVSAYTYRVQSRGGQ